ncbi:hypothetical protein [Campylobacter sp.]|uniref:hypothetical protein n=1 Tax=Campylobacter sp. TaxID=205 RepID=UPI002AA6FD84|nr:hypothetical protein [Campylobacter sp.]MCI6565266.1 hypothetical protein [Campylobacter sp.]MCI6579280.1 hypothetical protein [Campylobacter sp.]
MRAFIFALPLVFSACYLNERGISSTYYNDCKAYYDAAGVYHEGCEPNIIEFSDAKKLVNAKKTAVQQELERANAQRAKDEAAIDKLEEDFQKEEEQARKRATRAEELANKKEEQNNQETKDFGE